MVSRAHRAFGRLKMISHLEQAAVSAYRVGHSLRNISKCQAGRNAAFLRRKPQQGQYYGFPQLVHHWWCRNANVERMACSSCDTHSLMSAVVSCRLESCGSLYKVPAYRVGNCMSCQRYDPVKSVGFSASASDCHRHHRFIRTAPKAVDYDQQKLSQVTEAQFKRTGKLRKQTSTH